MYYKTLSVLLLSATAMAIPQEENSYSSIMSELDSLASNTQAINVLTAPSFPSEFASAAGIPASAAEAFISAVPTTFVQEILTNTAARSSLVQDVASSHYPAWYTSLPSNVQSQLASASGALETSATGASTTAKPTGSSSSSPQSGSSGSSASSSAGASASSSTKDSGAPAQTGAMAMSVAGAAGVLGLALAL